MLKQLRVVIRLQAEISLDDKNSATGLEEGAGRATDGGVGGIFTSMLPHGALKKKKTLLLFTSIIIYLSLASQQCQMFVHL